MEVAKRKRKPAAYAGTYYLLMHLDQAREIAIGRRGARLFPPGFYGYAGSALNGLEARIARHLREDKRTHWHIDYFLEQASLLEVLRIVSGRRLECRLSRAAARLAGAPVMPGFGSTDCRCPTHLHHFTRDPRADLQALIEKLRAGIEAPSTGE
ncbi:MAG: GIY-YIG nuclease family protein [Proteobacteria bacterium]|nr:GIY-YIG nuclease family protein [Pseudomonadota bacterium]